MESTRWLFHSVPLLCLMSTLGVLCRAAEIQIIRPPQNQTVQLDQRFKYYCLVANPEPFKNKISVKWFHNDSEMARRGQNYEIKKDGMLRFTKVKVVNRGWYRCRAEDSFKDVAEAEPAYLTVHAPAEILHKHTVTRPRQVTIGSVVQMTCEVVGIPTPFIEWRRNGVLILKNQSNQDNQTEHDTSEVSIASTLRTIVTETAVYTCSGVNFPLQNLANDSITVNITALETPVAADTPRMEIQVCAPYNGTTCRDYLQGRMVVHSGASSQEADAELQAHLRHLADLGLFSSYRGNANICEGPARRLLCHMTFPDCYNGTTQPVPICQESCGAVKSVLCFSELAELEAMKLDIQLNYSKGLVNLPDCLSLPSKWDTSVSCVESDHHDFSDVQVRGDCYMEKGRWYNGTVNTTQSGHACQDWLENFPHKHNRSPLTFPELLGAENFCRNPGGEEKQPWCYTTHRELRWEVCDIGPCVVRKEDTTTSKYPPMETEGRSSTDKEDEDLSLLYIVGACVLVTVCFVTGILCFLLRCYRRIRYSSTPQDDLDINVESLPINSAYHQMKSNRLNPKLEILEFPRNDIVFIEDIGQGAFGRVFKARIVCSNGNCHITGGKLSGSKHSLTCGRNCKNTRTPFDSKGDLRHLEFQASKHCDSKLLGEHLPMPCDFDKDDRNIKSSEGQLVAIKMLKEDASETVQADFEREASLMVEFDHANIVRLLGVCTVGKPMCLLFEYMSKGDLNEFLRLCSPDRCLRHNNARSNSSEHSSSISFLDQLYMARQVANGMIYLSERGYVHRDLATRNCLVGNNLTVKISDFGLARSIHSMDYYHGSDKDAIPIRWMPPEAILYNKFSSQSDVWSFGILLWEIFSFALQPYYGMTHEEVINYLRAGKVLAAPDNVPSAAYELMKSCWQKKASSRPSFVFLHKSLTFLHTEVMKQQTVNMLSV